MCPESGERRDAHNASVHEEVSRDGGCGQVHLPTGSTCTLGHGHRGSCDFVRLAPHPADVPQPDVPQPDVPQPDVPQPSTLIDAVGARSAAGGDGATGAPGSPQDALESDGEPTFALVHDDLEAGPATGRDRRPGPSAGARRRPSRRRTSSPPSAPGPRGPS